MLKVLHFSDLHANRKNLEKVKVALDHVIKTAEERKPDLILFTGDMWDGQTTIDYSSPLMMVIDEFADLSRISPIVIIRGTPSHDRPGSLEVFGSIRTKQPVFIIRDPEIFPCNHLNCFIYPIPAPTKSGLVKMAQDKGIELSPDKSDEVCADILHDILRGYGLHLAEARKQNPATIGIVAGHLTISGARTSTGQIMMSGDIPVPSMYLQEIEAELICLGHIHKHQIIDGTIFYPGSCLPVNWGEQEQKVMLYYELEPGQTVHYEAIPFPFPPMVDIEGTADNDGGINFQNGFDIRDLIGADVRIRIKIKISPHNKDLYTQEKFLLLLNFLASQAGLDGELKINSLKFEKIIETENRQRCEAITIARTNVEKLLAWGESNNTDITDGMIKCLEKAESGVAE